MTKRQTQREMARSCGPGHAGTAGGARRCRRQKLLETTDPDRQPLPGIRREKRRREKIYNYIYNIYIHILYYYKHMYDTPVIKQF